MVSKNMFGSNSQNFEASEWLQSSQSSEFYGCGALPPLPPLPWQTCLACRIFAWLWKCVHLGTGRSKGLDPKLHGLPFRSFNVGTVNRQTSSLSMIINVYHTYVLGDKSVPNEACQVYAACHLANHEDTLIRSVLSDSIPLSIFISASKKAATNSQHCLGIRSDKVKEIRAFNGIRSHSAPHVFLYLGSEPMSQSVSIHKRSESTLQSPAQSLYHQDTC